MPKQHPNFLTLTITFLAAVPYSCMRPDELQQVGINQPMGDDMEMSSSAPTTPSDALPRPHSEGTRAPASLENGIVTPQPSVFHPCPRSFAEKWSPASTVRSTPPIDVQQMSPAVRSSSSRGLDDIELAIDAKTPVAKPATVAPSSMEVAVIPSKATCGLVLPCPPSDAEKVMYGNRLPGTS